MNFDKLFCFHPFRSVFVFINCTVSSRDQSKSRFNVLPNLGYDARTVATHGGRADDEEDSDR